MAVGDPQAHYCRLLVTHNDEAADEGFDGVERLTLRPASPGSEDGRDAQMQARSGLH
jgi:hypothetical protein